MMKGSEIEKEVCAYAERLGFMTIKFKDLSRAGGPDRLFISPMGNIMFMEFKGESEPVSARQLDYITDLSEHHCIDVHIVRYVDVGISLIKSLRKQDREFGWE
ncbi:hypothetical protein [Thiolapillus sp.]|uniref:hypothetical protein n=1 Tax=Thiolapillus sp. TaxID=2017437 RepID=UPI003AF736B9